MAHLSLLPNGQRVYSSPCPEIAVQENPNIVPFLLYNDAPGSFPGISDRLRMTPERLKLPAFIDGPTGTVQTYADLRRDVERFALGLAAPSSPWAGVDENTNVALFSANHLLYPTVLLGCQRAGCTVTPANPNYVSSELKYLLEDSGATIVVCGESAVSKALEAMFQVGLPESHLIVLPDSATRPAKPSWGTEVFHGLNTVTVATVMAAGAVQPDFFEDIETGQKMPLLPPLNFTRPNEAKNKIAYIVYSSGEIGSYEH
jgi:acyl-CoA synthetase (AMP-forming)/AMP-acid ligase II